MSSLDLSGNSAFYEHNANSFFDATVHVEMGILRQPFLAQLAPGSVILDAGCGSGRDAKAFASLGYKVIAFDASPALATLATQHCGFPVQVRTFDDVEETTAYDGVWACASLLHVPALKMPATISRLWGTLRPGGCLYFSLKFGSGERIEDGRSFTDADEAAVADWMSGLTEIETTRVWVSKDQRPDRSQRWINVLAVRSPKWQRKLVSGGDDSFLPHLSKAMARASEIEIAVAFIKTTGLRLLLPDLLQAISEGTEDSAPPSRLRVLTSDYLDVTDPEALRLLLLLQARGALVRVYTTQDASFHLKAYIFARQLEGIVSTGTAFIGSSNISRQALQDGLEWNYRVAYPADAGFLEARQRFQELFHHPRAVPLTDAWIEAYEKRRVPPPTAIAPGSHESEPPPQPTSVQLRALEALESSRTEGFRRGLVVLATGLGKTWLAAFDASRIGARRILFVAHREEILDQAAQTFVRIRPGARVGFYTGQKRDMDSEVLCASVQTLARAVHLDRFLPEHFDYIVVDEFHHAAATTYRRLLGHFKPSFLLGLTATPDRTDHSDILSLCDDHLVFTCDLFEGVEAKLLAPFHYYGIHDQAVDYREIPWRNGRFDPEQLSNKLATLARARHALREWRARGQQRTLAFCVSVRHAEFMAEQFRKAGISAAAVYSGSSTGRAEALESLREHQLSVIFSVDLFNEGVDLPGIDTVMLLRPTESKILFLQQLGRGLRLSPGKQHLVVLDFIGNHQSFLHKPQALFKVASTYRALAAFARKAEQGALDLPEGCYVNFDLKIIEFLKSLDSAGTAKDYEALRSSLGRRPTLTEFYGSGASVQSMRQRYGSWFGLIEEMDDLTSAETKFWQEHARLLREIEVTAMTRSFKMVLLEALLELDGLGRPPELPVLATKSWEVLHRRPALLSDLPAHIRSLESGDLNQWQRYWLDNPVNAWTGQNVANAAAAFFRIADDRFELASGPIRDESAAGMIQELVDYRLAAYETRRPATESASNVIAFPARTRTELPYFPNLKIACGHFRAGHTDSEEHRTLPAKYGKLDPGRHFIARATGNSMDGGKHPIRDGDYLLLEHVSPTKAGSITGSVMAIERQDDAGDNQYLLRVVNKSSDGRYELKANNPSYRDLIADETMRTLARLKSVLDPLELQVGRTFAREDIPALFGDVFNPGNWNSGHVALNDRKVHVLLVTLNKQGKAEAHRYHDRWVDEHTFHWQSQNSTSPTGKRGQEIINHQQMGIAIHLFVREAKLAGDKAAPFMYYGPVQYKSHTGSNPMSVIFTLD